MSACPVLNHAKLIKQLHKCFGNLSGLLTELVTGCSYSLPLVRTRGPCPPVGWLLSSLGLSSKALVETGRLEADAEAAACPARTLLPCLVLLSSVFKPDHTGSCFFWRGRDKSKVLKPLSLL